MKRISTVFIQHERDNDSYPDYLKNEVDWDDQRIVSSMRYGEAEIEQHGWEQVAEWLHEDERLLQRWRDDEWWYINVGAVAVVEVSEDGEHWASERLEEYVCGVEYDLGNARNDEYLRDIHKSQLDAIRHELRWWGFTDDEIDQAFGNPDEIAVVEED